MPVLIRRRAGGRDRKDGTNIAGSSIGIYNNSLKRMISR